MNQLIQDFHSKLKISLYHTVMPLTPKSISEITQFVNNAVQCTGQPVYHTYFLTFDEKYVEYCFVTGCVPIMFYNTADNSPIGFICGKKIRIKNSKRQTNFILNVHLQCSCIDSSGLFEYMQHILKIECCKMYITSFEYMHLVTLHALNECVDDNDSYCTKQLYVRPINLQHPAVLAMSQIKCKVKIAPKIFGTFSYPMWFDKCCKIRYITPDLIDNGLIEHISQCITEHANKTYLISEDVSVYHLQKMLENPVFKNFLVYDESIDETIFISFLCTTLTNDDGDMLRVGHLYHGTFPRPFFAYIDSMLEWICKWIKEWDCFDIVAIEEMFNPNFTRISKFIPIGAAAVYTLQNNPIQSILPWKNGLKSI